MTSIAREHNLSVNTVQRVLESCSSKFYDRFERLPEHLAFDEFKGVGKKLHFIEMLQRQSATVQQQVIF